MLSSFSRIHKVEENDSPIERRGNTRRKSNVGLLARGLAGRMRSNSAQLRMAVTKARRSVEREQIERWTKLGWSAKKIHTRLDSASCGEVYAYKLSSTTVLDFL